MSTEPHHARLRAALPRSPSCTEAMATTGHGRWFCGRSPDCSVPSEVIFVLLTLKPPLRPMWTEGMRKGEHRSGPMWTARRGRAHLHWLAGVGTALGRIHACTLLGQLWWSLVTRTMPWARGNYAHTHTELQPSPRPWCHWCLSAGATQLMVPSVLVNCRFSSCTPAVLEINGSGASIGDYGPPCFCSCRQEGAGAWEMARGRRGPPQRSPASG